MRGRTPAVATTCPALVMIRANAQVLSRGALQDIGIARDRPAARGWPRSSVRRRTPGKKRHVQLPARDRLSSLHCNISPRPQGQRIDNADRL